MYANLECKLILYSPFPYSARKCGPLAKKFRQACPKVMLIFSYIAIILLNPKTGCHKLTEINLTGIE